MATSQHEAPRSGSVAQACERVAAEVETVICGKRPVIDLVLAALLAEGHVLLEDVPGVGKTSLAKALAATIEGDFGRIQFTPDLLPTDVSGVTIYRRGRDEFEFRPGPVFANIVLADEINRASPKTQAALLEAMAEEQVTVDGTTHPLAAPFLVLATQNPIEHEGTFPLPDSQLDRFLVRIDMGYPDAGHVLEQDVALRQQGGEHQVDDRSLAADDRLHLGRDPLAGLCHRARSRCLVLARGHPSSCCVVSCRTALRRCPPWLRLRGRTASRMVDPRAAPNGRDRPTVPPW